MTHSHALLGTTNGTKKSFVKNDYKLTYKLASALNTAIETNLDFTDDLLDISKTYTTTFTLMNPQGTEFAVGATTDDHVITWKFYSPDCVTGKTFVTAAKDFTVYYGKNNKNQVINYPWTFSVAKCAKNVNYKLTWTTSKSTEYTIPTNLLSTITINKAVNGITAGSVKVEMVGGDTKVISGLKQTITLTTGVNTCTSQAGTPLTITGATDVAEKQYNLGGSALFPSGALTWNWVAFVTSNESTCKTKISYKMAWNHLGSTTKSATSFLAYNGAYGTRSITITK